MQILYTGENENEVGAIGSEMAQTLSPSVSGGT